MALFLNLWIKLFFVLTPFFALTMFLSLTEGYEEGRRRKLALATSAGAAVISLLLFFAGRQVFLLFGITLDSFRIGAGILLLLSGIGLVHGKAGKASGAAYDEADVSIVPLAIPIIVGPATTGTILVMGAELSTLPEKTIGSMALVVAVASIAGVLLAGSVIQRCIGIKGISILSRLTGLILAALASQMIMTGIQGFMGIKS
jgi:multiple antibiotic resistance protein